MRASRIAFAAIFIAAAACTDSTSPAADSLTSAQLTKPPRKSGASAAATVPASLYSGYSPTSPHWSHITTMMTDFYYSWTTTERAWGGAHYDFAMSGTGSAWRATNPSVGHYPYALSWTTLTTSGSLASSYYADMKSWFSTRPQYALEKAFVHKKGSAGDSASRIHFSRWGSNRWAINPADAGAIAYNVSRIQRVVGSESGVFFDEASTGDINNWLPPTREFTTGATYFSALTKLVAAMRSGIGGKRILLNLAEYMTPADSAAAVAAGGVHLEMFNNFKQSSMISRWVWVGHLTTAGVFVDFVSTYSTQDMAGMATSYPKGNSTTNVQRAKLWELSSYYLAVGATPKLFALQLENQWNTPYSKLWTKAQEANIGHPLAIRVQVARGTDPQGNPYVVYNRDFDRALIILRLQTGWNAQTYGDGTAIPVVLPGGERWLPLNADGTVGVAITSLNLRNSEAAILLKGSKM
ncbi:MAG: hypothetical protein H0U66_14755 [Gemmatimonadaceae bacterium]|nr:hypothetical protein [Gemmatimonadaceae bacterium]